MLRLKSLLVLCGTLCWGSSALAQTEIDSVMLVVASRVDAISADTIRAGLRAHGVDVRTRDQATGFTDTVVLLIDRGGRRATAFTRTPEGIDVHVLHARGAADHGRWIAEPLARVILEAHEKWRPADLRDPWQRAMRGDFIARVSDGIIDPWAITIVASRIDVPAIADPWSRD